MKRISIILSFLFLICLAGTPLPLFAASPSKLVEEGNQLYRKGKYSQAIRKYEQAAVDLPESAEIYFNEGNAYLSQGDIEKARDLLLQAAQKSTDITLEARAKYNLGNLAFQEATKYQDDNLQKAISKLEESARLYRETLDLDPGDEDAKYNIEVARLLMKDILDKLKKPDSPPSPSGGEKQGEKQKKQEEEEKGKPKESPQNKKDETNKEKPEQKKVQITDTKAKDILEEEKKNREERNLPRPGGYRPVDKDW